MIEKQNYWFNYVTQAYEYIETPTDFTNFIPQDPAALGMYRCCIQLDMTPMDAAKKVLNACVREG